MSNCGTVRADVCMGVGVDVFEHRFGTKSLFGLLKTRDSICPLLFFLKDFFLREDH